MANREQAGQRRENMRALLAALRGSEDLTRTELMQTLGLSWACVSALTAALLGDGILCEEKQSPLRERGRIPSRLKLNPRCRLVGIDVNLRGLTVAVCDLYGRPLESRAAPIDPADASRLTASVLAALRPVLDGTGGQVLGIGIAMQGIRARDETGWRFPGLGAAGFSLDLRTAIEAETGLPVLVEHAPNCLLFGLVEAGDRDAVMMVRIDRGIGAALCRNGRFFADGALELGHVVISPDGRRLGELAALNCLKFNERSPDNALHEAGRCLGTALGNLCSLITVDRIILCGDLMQHADTLMPALKASYAKAVLPSQRAAITVEPLTDAAFGAAKLAAVRYPLYHDRI